MVALVVEAVNIHVSATAGVQECRTVDWYTIYQVNSLKSRHKEHNNDPCMALTQ